MIYVTGGTGFLGRHLIPALCRSGMRVRVLARYPEQHSWLQRYANVEVYRGDVLDRDSLLQTLDGCDAVVHAAGLFRFWGDEQAFLQTNARGTENMLEAAAQKNVSRFIHISTVAVVGNPDPQAIVDEETPVSPSDPYQHSKLQGEQIALRYFRERKVPVTILRPGAFYGPLGHYAFNRLFFKDPMRGIIMQVNGGRYIIFPVYIGDVAQGITKALEHGRAGEIYNLCGDWISHREAFDIICGEAGLHWPRLPIPGWLGIATARILEGLSTFTHREPFWPVNLRSYVYNNWRVSSTKAQRELGFAPMEFQEGARRTIAWYRAGQPDIWPELEC